MYSSYLSLLLYRNYNCADFHYFSSAQCLIHFSTGFRLFNIDHRAIRTPVGLNRAVYIYVRLERDKWSTSVAAGKARNKCVSFVWRLALYTLYVKEIIIPASYVRAAYIVGCCRRLVRGERRREGWTRRKDR